MRGVGRCICGKGSSRVGIRKGGGGGGSTGRRRSGTMKLNNG